MATNLEQTLESITSRFVKEIAAAVQADFSDRVRQLLGSSITAAPARRGPGRPPAVKVPAKRRGKGRRGTTVNTDAVLAFIKANPGQRTEQISKGLGYDAKPALAKLRAAHQVKTKGAKRAMMYSAA